jgi:predicted TPR repeat methyltransferase
MERLLGRDDMSNADPAFTNLSEEVSLEKMPIPQALAMAVQLHQQGSVDVAAEMYEAILEAQPGHPDALHFRGVALHQLDRSSEALPLLHRAIEVAPTHVDIRNNLGNVLRELGRFEEALTAYDGVLAIQPEHADALSNRGIVLRALGRTSEAAESYQRAIASNPDHPQAYHNLGSLLLASGKPAEASEAYRRAIAIHPRFVESYRRLARARAEAGDARGARAALQEWLAFDPENPVAKHMLAANSDEAPPARASDDYVRTAFDEFANSFEEVLDRLHYRVPQLIEQTLIAQLGDPHGDLEILDAGCGTGLCAPLLRGYAQRLVGVDLSARMLARARGTGLYDDLVEAELTALLRDRPRAFDLILVADTLCYFGDLHDAFAAAAATLRPRGHLVLTVELSDEPDSARGYLLHEHGRYSHTRNYLIGTLERCGLRVRQVTEEVLREEMGRDVPGLIAVAQRPDTES